MINDIFRFFLSLRGGLWFAVTVCRRIFMAITVNRQRILSRYADGLGRNVYPARRSSALLRFVSCPAADHYSLSFTRRLLSPLMKALFYDI